MRRAVVLLLFVVVVGACGIASEGTPSAADYRAAISEALRIDRGEASVHFTADQADCAAGGITDGISPGRLRDLDVGSGSDLTKVDFSAAERSVVFDAIRACVDLADQVAGTIGGDSGLPDDVASCVAERYVATDTFRDALLSSELDAALNDRIDAALDDALAACTAGGSFT